MGTRHHGTKYVRFPIIEDTSPLTLEGGDSETTWRGVDYDFEQSPMTITLPDIITPMWINRMHQKILDERKASLL